MQIMMHGRTVNLPKDKISELWVDKTSILYTWETDPDEVFTLYEATDKTKAIYIYDKITKGWKDGWKECLLQAQTKE